MRTQFTETIVAVNCMSELIPSFSTKKVATTQERAGDARKK